MFTAGETVGLAVWIIDDNCLVTNNLTNEIFWKGPCPNLLCVVSSVSTTLEKEIATSLANLRWPTRPQPIGGHYLHTWCPLFCFPGLDVSVVACIYLVPYGRTDIPCENKDHLFGRGLWVNNLYCWDCKRSTSSR